MQLDIPWSISERLADKERNSTLIVIGSRLDSWMGLDLFPTIDPSTAPPLIVVSQKDEGDLDQP